MSDANERKSPDPVSDWKKSGGPQTTTLPSGKTAMIRRRPLEVMWKIGLIPNKLIHKVREMITLNKSLEPDDTWTEEELTGLIELFDKLVVFNWAEPRVYDSPMATSAAGDRYIDDDAKEIDKLYVDEIDLQDKIATFAFVTGGLDDLERFREEHAPDVELVPDSEDVELPSESTSVAG